MSGVHRLPANLAGDGRGILALDDDAATVSARLAEAGAHADEETRRAYHELVLTAPGLAAGISGVVLTEEAFGGTLPDGEPYAEALIRAGIAAGVRVDTGVHPLAGLPGEHVTEGLDGLRIRFADLASRGARFATWRSVLRVGDRLPSCPASRANAHAMARFSALCHETGIVPVLEPELSAEGTHSLAHCCAAAAVVLSDVFGELRAAGLRRHAVVLAPTVMSPGDESGERRSAGEIAEATIGVLRAAVPGTVACVAVRRGDQETVAALRAIPAPWPVTFSVGAARAFAVWRGRADKIAAAQRVLRADVRAFNGKADDRVA